MDIIDLYKGPLDNGEPQWVNGLSPDWLYCTRSNYHICNDRKWFEKEGFVTIKSFVATPDAKNIPVAKIKGVGNVILPVIKTLTNNVKGREEECSRTLHLANVLFVPNARCNILCSFAGKILGVRRTDDGNRFFPADPDKRNLCLGELRSHPKGDFLAFIEPTDAFGLKRIMLRKTMSLAASRLYHATTPDFLALYWPDKQRDDTEKEVNARTDKKYRETPLTKQEHAWLRKTYNATFAEYALSVGLDYDRPEDQCKVRWGIRQAIKREYQQAQEQNKINNQIDKQIADKERRKEERRQRAQDKREGSFILLDALDAVGESNYWKKMEQKILERRAANNVREGESKTRIGNEDEGEDEDDDEDKEEDEDEAEEETKHDGDQRRAMEEESRRLSEAETLAASDDQGHIPAYLRYSRQTEASKTNASNSSDNDESFGQGGPRKSLNRYAIHSKKLSASEEDDLLRLPNIKRDCEL